MGKTAESQSDSKHPSLPPHETVSPGALPDSAELTNVGVQRLAQQDRSDLTLSPSLPGARRERTILAMQRIHGNAFVQRLLPDSGVAAAGVDQVLAQVVAGRDQIAAALASKDPADVKAIADFSQATVGQKIDLIRILVSQTWVGPRDETKIEQLWESFGDQLPTIMATQADLWRTCLDAGAELDHLPSVVRLRDLFPDDVKRIVAGYLDGNLRFVMSEIDRMGFSLDRPAEALPPTAEQVEETQQMQTLAAAIAKLQSAQEAARNTYVGHEFNRFHKDETGPALSPQQQFQPVKFNPYTGKPPFDGPPPKSWFGSDEASEEDPRFAPYEAIKEHYDAADDLIAKLLALNPSLYAVSRHGKSDTTGAFAAIADPVQARRQLGGAMVQLLADIAVTRVKLEGGDVDPLDLVPVHAQLLRGVVAAPSGTKWTEPLPLSIAEELVRDHDFQNFLTALGLEMAAAALFALAPFTGGASLYVALAGLAVTGTKLALSAEHYQTLAMAAKTSVTPGTELVSGGQVEEAKLLMEADQIALLLAALTVGTMAAAKVIGAVRGPSVRVNWNKPLSASGFESSFQGNQVGVFEGSIRGVKEPVAIKVYPAGHSVYANDLRGAKVAARTGMGPKFYGEVDVGPGKQAFAMEKVPGGFIESSPHPMTANAQARATTEAAHYASKVSPQTVTDARTYRALLQRQGYYYDGEVQGMVDDAGRWRPIDFQAIRPLPPTSQPAARQQALLMNRSMFDLELDSLIKQARANGHVI